MLYKRKRVTGRRMGDLSRENTIPLVSNAVDITAGVLSRVLCGVRHCMVQAGKGGTSHKITGAMWQTKPPDAESALAPVLSRGWG